MVKHKYSRKYSRFLPKINWSLFIFSWLSVVRIVMELVLSC